MRIVIFSAVIVGIMVSSPVALTEEIPVSVRPSAASVDVFSDPPGARISLDGPMEITGITPFTGANLPLGKYSVKVVHPGFTSSRNSIILDSTSSSRIDLDLIPKERASAVARSMVLPGWGQLYYGSQLKGNSLLVGGMIALAGHTILGSGFYNARENYKDARDQYKGYENDYKPGSGFGIGLEDLEKAGETMEEEYTKMQDAYDYYVWSGWVLGAVWTLSFLDAFYFFPDYKPGLLPGDGELILSENGTSDGLNLNYIVSFE